MAGSTAGTAGAPEGRERPALHGEFHVVDDVADEFAERCVEAFLSRPDELFRVALSGGETARRCYEAVAGERGAAIDWSRVDVLWGDERCVPLDDPDANYRLAREALLERVVGTHATHPMICEEGAGTYQEVVASHDPLDLVHLGVGTDGHTASLFPGSAALDAEPGVLVALNEDPAGANPHRRMTLTLRAIERARLAVVTVSGAEKAEVVARLWDGEDLPAGRVRADRVVWLVDRGAASELPAAR